MCEQCSAKTFDLGEIAPKYVLCRATIDGNLMKKGDWGILLCDDPDFVWDSKWEPIEEPYKNIPDDQQTHEQMQEWDKFCDITDEINKVLCSDIPTCYYFYRACLESGYNEGLLFSQWLVDRMGKIIREYKESGRDAELGTHLVKTDPD